VLMPLGLIPAQWDPIMDGLAENYCTITLGRPHLGMVAPLKMGAAPVCYRDMLGALVQDMAVEATEWQRCGYRLLTSTLPETNGSL